MANFKKTGDLYVSKSGSNANAGTDPDLPKLTIQAAIDVATTGQRIIVGDGLYEESELDFGVKADLKLYGDGIVILEGDNTQNLIISRTNRITFENIIAVNYAFFLNRIGGTGAPNLIELLNCIIINSPIYARRGNGTSKIVTENCRFINSNVDAIDKIQNLTSDFNRPPEKINTVFINSSVKCNTRLINCYFDSTVELTSDDLVATTGTFNIQQSNFNSYLSTITYQGTLYPALADHQAENPTVDQNSIDQEALFNRTSGEITPLDFTVQGNSPLLGVGENGTNIGGVRRGLPQSRLSPSVQNGTISNIVFDGQTWRVQDGETTGVITTAVIDFGLTVKSPKLTIKGIVNFLDNVPDFDNALLNPNKLDIEARYAVIGEDITLATYKPFLLNERMLLDSTNKSNGESGFDWDDTLVIPMKQIQLRITLRQNYNAG